MCCLGTWMSLGLNLAIESEICFVLFCISFYFFYIAINGFNTVLPELE